LLVVLRKSEEKPPAENSTRISRWPIMQNLPMLNQEKTEGCEIACRT